MGRAARRCVRPRLGRPGQRAARQSSRLRRARIDAHRRAFQADGSAGSGPCRGTTRGEGRRSGFSRAYGSGCRRAFRSGRGQAGAGPEPAGARTYLAVKGGWQTRSQLGSRSSEQRLRAGEVLPAAAGIDPHSPSRASRLEDRRPTSRSASSPAPTAGLLRARMRPSGPTAGFGSGSQSNRMGLRLEGDPVTIDSPCRAALDPGRAGRHSGGGRATDRPGCRLRHDGGLSPRRPCDLRRSRPPGPAQAGR